MSDPSPSHTFTRHRQLRHTMSSIWRHLLRSLLAIALFLTLLGQDPVLAESTSCNTLLGWWETPALEPLFTFNAPTQDCDFQQWSWTAFIHFMQKTGPEGKPLFLSLPTAQDLERKLSATETIEETAAPTELMLKPRFQKPGLAFRRRGDELNSIEQAGSDGILVSQNSRVIYYSIHMNPEYFEFAKAHMGNENYNKTSPTTNFPIDSTVLKASWMVVDDAAKLPKDTFTTKATIQLLEEDPAQKGQLKTSELTKSGVTVALLGIHVVGAVKDHPEFIWATFEQKNNAPNLPAGTVPGSNQSVNNQQFTLYKAGTKAQASNQKPAAYSLDFRTQKARPVTNVFRQFAYGGAEFSSESPTVTGQSRVDDINSINSNVQAAIPEHSDQIDPVFANYNLIGSVWLDSSQTPLEPGLDLFANSIGSITLANSTMETFAQGIGTNCFSCHTTQPFPTESKFADKNIAISHIIAGSLKQPKATNEA